MLCTSIHLQAQQTNEAVKLVYDFAKSYSEIDSVKDTEHVLRLVDRDLKSSLTDFDTKQGVKTINSDFFGLNEHLNSIVRNEIDLDYNITEIIKSDLTGSFAYVIFEASYKATINNKPFDNGTETVMMTLIKNNDEWKINNYYVVDIKKETPKTTCYATVFKSSQNNNEQLLIKLDTPDGRSLLSEFIRFLFEKNKSGGWIVNEKNTKFEVDKTGNITVLSSTSNVKGTAKVQDVSNVTEIALVLIKSFLSQFAKMYLLIQNKIDFSKPIRFSETL